MNVLNTYGGGVKTAPFGVYVLIGLGVVLAACFAVKRVLASIREDAIGPILLAAFLVLVAIAIAYNPKPVPVRHEVTLRPGAVIDAAKYTIVEQRGEIYVIEERTETEE